MTFKYKRGMINVIGRTYYICLQERKPPLELHEVDHDWPNIKKTVGSTDYWCPNGDRWRGLLVYKEQKLSLYVQLTSAVIPVTVEVR